MLYLIILALIFVAMLVVFFLIPFKHKGFQMLFILAMVAFVVGTIFIPSTNICSIHLPVINCSINELIEDILSKSDRFNDINELAPSIKKTLMTWIQNIVKASVVFVVVGVATIVTSLVLCLVRLCIKKERNITSTFATTLGCVFLSAVILFIPLGNVCLISQTLKNQLGKEDEPLYVTYPELEKYGFVFDMLDVQFLEDNPEITELSNKLISGYDGNSSKSLVDDLNMANQLVEKLEKTGIMIIYTDPNFDFSKTQKDTFDFNEMESLIELALSTQLYNDIPRGFVNQIMRELEKIVIAEFNVNEDINLEFSKEEFKEQYKMLMTMLKFVVDHDLVRFLNLSQNDLNESVDSILGVVSELTTLTEIISSPLIKKIDDGGVISRSVTTIKLCIRLYSALNNWLEEYKATSLYETSSEFLKGKGALV